MASTRADKNTHTCALEHRLTDEENITVTQEVSSKYYLLLHKNIQQNKLITL